MDRIPRLIRGLIPLTLIAAAGTGFDAEPPTPLPGALEAELRGCPDLRHQFPEGTPRHAIVLNGELHWSGDDMDDAGIANPLDDSFDDIVSVRILCPPFVRTSFDIVVWHASIVIYTAESGVQGVRDDLRALHAAQSAHRALTGEWARSLEELGWEEGSPGVSIRFEDQPPDARGWRAVATHPAYIQSCAIGAGFGANPSEDFDPDTPYCRYLEQRVTLAPTMEVQP